MNVLIIDTETTGVSPKKDTIIEIGAVLFSVEHRCVLHQMSALLPCQDNPAESINGIPTSALNDAAVFAGSFHREFLNLASVHASYAMAHNHVFDKDFLASSGLPIDLPWIDSQDIPFPRKHKEMMSLVELCLAHGIPVVSAHRALTDCQLLAELLRRQDNLEYLIDKALEPKALFIAKVGYDRKDEAKALGFIWDRLVKKQWARKMTIDDAKKLPFEVSLVES